MMVVMNGQWIAGNCEVRDWFSSQAINDAFHMMQYPVSKPSDTIQLFDGWPSDLWFSELDAQESEVSLVQ